jgi:cytochrome c peroxidase
MKKITFLSILVIAMAMLSMSTREKKKDLSDAVSRISKLYIRQAKSLDSFLQAYPKYFYDSSHAVREKKYEELSYYFKRASGVILYFEPEMYYEKLVAPFAFQKNDSPGFYGVLPDAWLFLGPIGNEPDSTLLKGYSKADSVNQRNFIIKASANYRQVLRNCRYAEHISAINESTLFDILRTEIFRISTVDIANSDFVIDEAAMPSLNGSIDSWLLFMSELVNELPSSQSILKKQWAALYAGTRQFLADNKSYRDFNRMSFTRNYLLPLSRLLNDLQVALKVPFIKKFAALRADARHIYDKNIFNTDYFAPSTEAYYSAEKAALGELLFFDPILSDNNKRACASCHKPELAFTDGRSKSMSFDMELLPRNAPTVINAGFQKKQFWDLRAASLEDQLDSVVNNVAEMHSTFDGVVDKLNASPEYLNLFHKAFPATKQNGIKRADIKHAIGIYERTLTGLNSRFDQYMQGDVTKLTTEEINGFNLYMGKAKCGVCHTAPLFNGAQPPFFDLTSFQSLGVPIRDSMTKYVVDPDLGLMKVNGDAFHRFSFKTPTVRNASLTGPYMHNGVYKTLEQVVDFYDHAGGNKFAKDMRPDMIGLPFFTILPIELKLTPVEKKELIAFMRALTDTTASSMVPTRLPEFRDPYTKLNKRVIGGEY